MLQALNSGLRCVQQHPSVSCLLLYMLRLRMYEVSSTRQKAPPPIAWAISHLDELDREMGFHLQFVGHSLVYRLINSPWELNEQTHVATHTEESILALTPTHRGEKDISRFRTL